ncbi:hypothetical protein SARC_03708 [Sphaeroforma arctica JP610]|uniref:Uncharacterized protein n=1 Tax=Sphaeroforma arctica JP610 TaxID=667725 RepID=A0A0L0G4Y8_9EUKA|nr:hypothetical protein SARC_03708 [Sphaeroforma arctica JP610]KNC84080.1 hypothetical protein SARC_03708 [Sphaeroforma arctica JP610]|eukprot:XP_014157982.1 hypothetical protein SARC_03708 [Sphaeroforma arctica JP610]
MNRIQQKKSASDSGTWCERTVSSRNIHFNEIVIVAAAISPADYDRSACSPTYDYCHLLQIIKELRRYKRNEMHMYRRCDCIDKHLSQSLWQMRQTGATLSVNFLSATSFSVCEGVCLSRSESCTDASACDTSDDGDE